MWKVVVWDSYLIFDRCSLLGELPEEGDGFGELSLAFSHVGLVLVLEFAEPEKSLGPEALIWHIGVGWRVLWLRLSRARCVGVGC